MFRGYYSLDVSLLSPLLSTSSAMGVPTSAIQILYRRQTLAKGALPNGACLFVAQNDQCTCTTNEGIDVKRLLKNVHIIFVLISLDTNHTRVLCKPLDLLIAVTPSRRGNL